MGQRDRNNVYNFGAGPAAMPQAVLEKARDEMLNYNGTGMSVMELSHRSAAYEEIQEEAEQALRSVLGIPSEYRVLFLQGGASLQFSMVPMNFLPSGGQAAYVLTGSWAEKALEEAKLFGEARVAASTKAEGYCRIPDWSEVDVAPEDAYVHITTNNTIVGSQWHVDPADPRVPLVADMSSDICSRPVNVQNYSLIYAGAQKNLGPSGVTVVIVKPDWLEHTVGDRPIPTMLKYAVHAKSNSRYNTPPVFAVYMLKLTAEWILQQGGLSAVEGQNREKASWIYGEIDESDGFYRGVVEPNHRSLMNATFRIADPAMEQKFLQEAKDKGFIGLSGHRSVGGIRASMYNAVPAAACQQLREFMRDFRKRNI